MKKFISIVLLLISLPGMAALVTFQVNMNGYTGFSGLAVSGTFNNWCGNCNLMSDSDGDGIYTAAVNIPDGSIQYKFSFGNWQGQENLTASSGCVAFDGPFVNRELTVQSNTTLSPVCWGLCGNCIEPDDEIWELSWSDEFDGTALDQSSWTYELGASGWGNNELQNYTSSSNNLSVADGMLTITARQESAGSYTSARIITNNKVELKYGKIEARLKAPTGQGIWPAFWMLGANFESVSWPQCGEIDIMEHVNNEPLTNSAMHWNQNGHTYRANSIPYERNEFHLYGAIWNETGITLSVDDSPFWYMPFSASNNTIPIFQRDFFFLLNVAVGGNWPGNPDNTTVFPASMQVDYIRVFTPSVLSVREDLSKADVRFFPVPAADLLNIQFGHTDSSRRLEIYDLSGRLIAEQVATSDRLQISVDQWQAGAYFVRVISEGGISGYMVVKE